MDDALRDLRMKVDGMTCEGCVEAVTRVVRRLDPDARVTVDLARGEVALATRVESLEIAEALTRAGYEAHAMTG
jgi:copper chaperone